MPSSFKPAKWLSNPHLQTLWSELFRRAPLVKYQRERFELSDGDFVDLDWAGDEKLPIVILLHGLAGSARSSYMRGMVNALIQNGWRTVVMHFRGCGGELNRLARSYHAGDIGDISEVVENLKNRFPEKPIAAVGFSLGANVLLTWLGRTGENNPLTTAVAISVPFDLSKCVERLQQGFSRAYDQFLLRTLTKTLKLKIKKHPDLQYLSKKTFKTLRDFDEHVTAPLHGFLNAEDYYAQSNSKQYLKNISKPTLIIHSADDPFLGSDNIPTKAECSTHITFEKTEHGGHLGFISGSRPWNTAYWLEERVVKFLNKKCNHHSLQ